MVDRVRLRFCSSRSQYGSSVLLGHGRGKARSENERERKREREIRDGTCEERSSNFSSFLIFRLLPLFVLSV